MTEQRKNLYVCIQGGLGNQLFQIAAGHGWMKKYPDRYILTYLGPKPDPPAVLKKIMDQENYNYQPLSQLIPKLKEEYSKGTLFFYDEDRSDRNAYACNDSVLDSVHNMDVYMSGYFQNEKYFKAYKEKLLLYYVEEDRVTHLIQKYPSAQNSYFIHIRRGDYVNHGLLGIDLTIYFKSAIYYLLNKDPDSHFYIISDDIEYCKQNLIFENINKTFIEGSSELDDFYLISLCKRGGICSNSTFSWWGSYLNTNPKKIVTFPSKWLNNDWINEIYYENSIIIQI
jgi:hypothetical protein